MAIFTCSPNGNERFVPAKDVKEYYEAYQKKIAEEAATAAAKHKHITENMVLLYVNRFEKAINRAIEEYFKTSPQVRYISVYVSTEKVTFDEQTESWDTIHYGGLVDEIDPDDRESFNLSDKSQNLHFTKINEYANAFLDFKDDLSNHGYTLTSRFDDPFSRWINIDDDLDNLDNYREVICPQEFKLSF
tara:strand:- start:651 stop:1217 length:567 start_codon:yes stop_codon:yes gene_type:complete